MKQTTLDLPRRMLASHRWLGLAAAVLLYLICFSGVLSVLAQELERWEQPGVDEFTQVDAEFVDRAYRRFLAEVDAPTEHIHIVYPRRAIPRLVVENDEQAFFINHDGSLGPEEHAPWTKMVTAIHHHLQLPQLIGSIILGIVAVMMLGLLISGLLAHTTILREAFSLRFNRGKKMRHIDTHNRLSVWGLPFHLMIIFTSAYFGLAGILLALAAELFHDGDRQAIIDTVFGQEPTLIEQAKVVDVAAAIKNMQQLAPGAKTVFSTIHEAGSESQFIEFYNVKDGRLIYSENYRFDAAGALIEITKPENLPVGAQILLSSYRLHFGDYYGFSVKLLYLVMGLALTWMVVSGVNIWFAKRRQRDLLNRLWAAVSWGLPLGFALSLAASTALSWSPTPLLWGSTLASLCAARFYRDETQMAQHLFYATATALGFALLAYNYQHWAYVARPAAMGMNSFIGGALLLTLLCRPRALPSEPR